MPLHMLHKYNVYHYKKENNGGKEKVDLVLYFGTNYIIIYVNSTKLFSSSVPPFSLCKS